MAALKWIESVGQCVRSQGVALPFASVAWGHCVRALQFGATTESPSFFRVTSSSQWSLSTRLLSCLFVCLSLRSVCPSVGSCLLAHCPLSLSLMFVPSVSVSFSFSWPDSIAVSVSLALALHLLLLPFPSSSLFFNSSQLCTVLAFRVRLSLARLSISLSLSQSVPLCPHGGVCQFSWVF